MVLAAFLLTLAAGIGASALFGAGIGIIVAVAIMGSYILWVLRDYLEPKDGDDGDNKS